MLSVYVGVMVVESTSDCSSSSLLLGNTEVLRRNEGRKTVGRDVSGFSVVVVVIGVVTGTSSSVISSSDAGVSSRTAGLTAF